MTTVLRLGCAILAVAAIAHLLGGPSPEVPIIIVTAAVLWATWEFSR